MAKRQTDYSQTSLALCKSKSSKEWLLSDATANSVKERVRGFLYYEERKRVEPLMNRLFLVLLFASSVINAQTFRLARPVPDDIQTNGSYLYGEPNINNSSLAHTGIDISIKYDTVRSASVGVVSFVGYDSTNAVGGYEPTGAGNYIYVQSKWNNKDLYVLYGHLLRPIISVNDSVKIHQPLAISGTTGNSTGPHLHFELRLGTRSTSALRNRRNAELWCAISGMGAIYGRIPNAANSTRVDIAPNPKPRPPYTSYGYSLTYNFNDSGIGSDDIYQENYAIGDVKPGTYTITALSGTYKRTVTVKAGEIVNADAAATWVNRESALPRMFSLEQNYPNPFNSETVIMYQLSTAGDVRLTVIDLLGREVRTLVDASQSPGTYRVIFDAGRLSSGVYFYLLNVGNVVQTKAMTLMK